jgi:hypothetical protein
LALKQLTAARRKSKANLNSFPKLRAGSKSLRVSFMHFISPPGAWLHKRRPSFIKNIKVLAACSGPPATPATAPAEATPPASATASPGDLNITFAATFSVGAQSAALNLSAALQTDMAAVLQMVALKHGPLAVSGA